MRSRARPLAFVLALSKMCRVQEVLQAINDPRRREILRLVSRRELAAGEIHGAFGDVTFGAVSQHLRVLAEAGLVEVRRDGRHRRYRARLATLAPLRAWLEQMWTHALDDLAALAEEEAAQQQPQAEAPRKPARTSPRTLTRTPGARR